MSVTGIFLVLWMDGNEAFIMLIRTGMWLCPVEVFVAGTYFEMKLKWELKWTMDFVI